MMPRLTASALSDHTAQTRRNAAPHGITDLTGRRDIAHSVAGGDVGGRESRDVDAMSCATGMTVMTGMNKFQRAIQRADCFKIMAGINMQDSFTGMKRGKTNAEKESPDEWFGKVQKHYDIMVLTILIMALTPLI